MKHLKSYKIFENYNYLLDPILDKISKSGMDSLTSLEKETLDAISNNDQEFLDNLKKRENDYYQLLNRDMRKEIPEEHAKEMNDYDILELNLMTLWDTIDPKDIAEFIEINNYPKDVTNMPWDKLSGTIQKDFYDFSRKYI